MISFVRSYETMKAKKKPESFIVKCLNYVNRKTFGNTKIGRAIRSFIPPVFSLIVLLAIKAPDYVFSLTGGAFGVFYSVGYGDFSF